MRDEPTQRDLEPRCVPDHRCLLRDRRRHRPAGGRRAGAWCWRRARVERLRGARGGARRQRSGRSPCAAT